MQKYQVESLISEEKIRETIDGLAKQIFADYGEQEVILVGVLDGAYPFLHDFSRALLALGMKNIIVDFIGIDTYGGGTESSGEPKITKDIKRDIKNRTVLIVEDIVDTGFSLSVLQAMLAARQPKKLATVALLSKRARRKIEVPIEYIGQEIEDKFVVGYGLDFDGRLRELPYIGVVVFEK